MARRGLGPFSLIWHVGRRSGRSYETPVIVVALPEGFIAELTYGDKVDWYRNLIAAGGGAVVYRGKEHGVNRIEPSDADVARRGISCPIQANTHRTAMNSDSGPTPRAKPTNQAA
jgi:deazaflavin-dependent oxidoreductase (nitroreductase family)